ncbi:MAG: hypothetical protein NC319_05225 [Butyricicoccus sp.]|nr:hypothetical protein [Butyricicoccus sp.]
MHIRKLAGFLAVLVLAFGILASTALACHGHNRGTYAASYSLCQTEGCELAGRHGHGGANVRSTRNFKLKNNLKLV